MLLGNTLAHHSPCGEHIGAAKTEHIGAAKTEKS